MTVPELLNALFLYRAIVCMWFSTRGWHPKQASEIWIAFLTTRKIGMARKQCDESVCVKRDTLAGAEKGLSAMLQCQGEQLHDYKVSCIRLKMILPVSRTLQHLQT